MPELLALAFLREYCRRGLEEVVARYDAEQPICFLVFHHRNAIKSLHRQTRGDVAARLPRKGYFRHRRSEQRTNRGMLIFRRRTIEQCPIDDADEAARAHDRIGTELLLCTEVIVEHVDERR